MKLSIQNKLLAAMLSATLAVVGYMAVVIQWSFDRGFLEYVNLEEQKEINRLAQQLEIYYAQYQSWDRLIDQPLVILKMHALTLPKGGRRDRLLDFAEKGEIPEWLLDHGDQDKKKPRHPVQRTVLVDEEQNVLFGRKQAERLPHMVPIMFQNRVVGNLGIYPPQQISEAHQLLFVERQKLVTLMVVIAAAFIAIAISLPLAYHLTKPIRRLSEATKQLISGDYSTRITSHARDELGRLSNDINTLAQTLEDNETQRKIWVSDIAHELRTPLTSLVGEIEALQDGIRQPNQRTYSNLHEGVMRLSRLIEDLYDLSQSDLGILSIIPERIDFHSLVEYEVLAHQNEAKRAGLHLKMEKDSESPPVHGDPQRLQQLIDNLLVNSIRYTDRGGTVTVEMKGSVDSVQLDVKDTAPGVPDSALPRLFNRLFRVDKSRNRAFGGSGLGLAICKQIVTAHNGTITAQHSPSGGLWIQVILPIAQEVA